MANTFRHGDVKIANDILADLAIKASEEVVGVKNFANKENKISINQMGPKANVSTVGSKLHVDLTVNLDENVNVRKTVKAIQENVISVIESMTGLPVARVNVSVGKLEI